MSFEDTWEDPSMLFEASFAGVRFDVLSLEQEAGRALARAEYPHVDGASLADMGAKARIARVQLIFCALGGRDYKTRFDAFVEAKDSGEAKEFVHPIEGSYAARVSDFRYRVAAEPRECIVVDCSFEEDRDVQVAFQDVPGVPEGATMESLLAAAQEFDAAVTGAGLPPSTFTRDMVDSASSWSDKTTRQIRLELGTLQSRFATLQDELDLARDVKRYPLVRAGVLMYSQLTRFALTVQQHQPRVIEITVTRPMPLIVIASRTYGAREAPARAEEMRDLNKIRNPARVEAGTLRAYSPAAAPRLRSAA